ncbi:MAG: zinc ribbon domain-containing protein [Nitrospirota bacterium]|jgi:putative FmdB family regulatory protein
MPIYEYRCLDCQERHEAWQKFSDPRLETCPHCGGRLTKLISSTSFVLKGGGWYADGYASADKNNGGNGEKKTSAEPAEPKAGEKKASTESTGSKAEESKPSQAAKETTSAA